MIQKRRIFLCLTLLFSGVAWAQGIEKPLFVECEEFMRSVAQNGINFSEANIAQIQKFIRAANAIAAQPKAEAISCYESARRDTNLAGESAWELCLGGGTPESVDCYKKTLADTNLGGAFAIQLCKGRGTPRALGCFKEAIKLSAYTGAGAIDLCRENGSPETVECVRQTLSSTHLTFDWAHGLCKKGGDLSRLECFKLNNSMNLSAAQALAICSPQ